MQYKTIFRLIGLLLIQFSFSMLPPLLVSAYFAEYIRLPFLASFALVAILGIFLATLFREHREELKIRDGFLMVVIIWLCVSFFGSLPFIFYDKLGHSFTDIFFETVSGLTTTGATTFLNLDALPRTILYYRQQLQFIGGMGIIVLAVAIFPMLGIGGTQMFRAETSGPQTDKLTPRITQTAKALWGIYTLLMLLCASSYWYCGMDWFQAIGESFGTVSTGGFSMHDESFFYYHNNTIELFACMFMLISSFNFALHFFAVQRHSMKFYWQDEEFRFFIKTLCLGTVILLSFLWTHDYFNLTHRRVIDAVFLIISMVTTTGFTLIPFNDWPSFTPILVILMSLVGGCAGSTTGGFKVLRLMLIWKQSMREFFRMLHPQANVPVKVNHLTVAESTIQLVMGYTCLFFGMFAILILISMALGNDFITSFSAVAGCLANSGTGIGAVSHNFASITDQSKWLLTFTMLLGRLELYPIMILFTRAFWVK